MNHVLPPALLSSLQQQRSAQAVTMKFTSILLTLLWTAAYAADECEGRELPTSY